MGFLQNTRRPEGLGGRLMVSMMNRGTHAALSEWGLSHLNTEIPQSILEMGCGGGANIRRLMKKYPEARVTGADYSEVSVEKSRTMNRRAIEEGKCAIVQENVRELTFPDQTFELVTAFETVYFWPELTESFREIYRVLKPGGTFFICNETDGDDPADYKWELTRQLKAAGFATVDAERNPDPKNSWICLIARRW